MKICITTNAQCVTIDVIVVHNLVPVAMTHNVLQISEVMIIEIEGLKLEIADRPPINGEMYVAERNVGKQLLTAKFVDNVNRWVIPVEKAYVYDLCECKVVVKMVE